MREMGIYRGKRKDNGEFVEGYYFKTPLTEEATIGSQASDGWFFLAGKERHCISRNNCVFEVDPDTVGEYTGLTDKNGKRIFEGDIVLSEIWHGGPECYMAEEKAKEQGKTINWFQPHVIFYDDIDAKFRMVHVSEYGKGYCGYSIPHIKNYPNQAVEVVGNIYDSPELMYSSIST